MRRVRKRFTKSQRKVIHRAAPQAFPLDDGTLATPGAIELIQTLIPLGVRAVEEALQAEVRALAGPRYARHDERPDVVRWGQQAGSIFVADQKLPISVPRVRDRSTGHEVPLTTYAQLQTPRSQDVGLFRRVLGGLSCREYESAAEAVPEAFGLAKSSVSRRFVRASASELRRLFERRHDDAEWLVLVLDGKSFAGDQLVIALGVTTTGEKRILGLVQTASENQRVIASFLRDLGDRGLPLDRPLLVVIDGAKGLRAAVRDVFGDVPVQRCQWHKRENVVSYLAQAEQAEWRRKLQAAYAHPSYADAKRALAAARTRAARAQCVGRRESRGRSGGNAHAPSAKRLPRARSELQDDKSDRERHVAAGGEHAPGDALADERSEAAVVRCRPVGDGKAVPPREAVSSSALAQAGLSRQTLAHEVRRGVSRIIGGIA